MVGAGAKVLGPFKIGNNVKIAAGAVVLEAIPDNCTAAGVPARVVRNNGAKVCKELDQIHIPDPVSAGNVFYVYEDRKAAKGSGKA